MFDVLSLKGHIVATVEDRQGNVIQQVQTDNIVTDHFKKWSMYNMFNTYNNYDSYSSTLYGLQCITQMTVKNSEYTPYSNLLGLGIPNDFGIYLLGTPIETDRDMGLSPAFDRLNPSFLSPDVTFYHTSATTIEDQQQMMPNKSQCYFEPTKNEYIFEYLKNTGAGDVRSLVICSRHGNKDTTGIRVSLTEPQPPIMLQTAQAYYLMEYTDEESYIWLRDNNRGYRIGLTGKTIETFGQAAYDNIGTYTGGCVIGNILYRLTRLSASGTTHTARLQCINNFRTESTIINRDIAFPVSNGGTLNTGTYPVMVHRRDTGNIEIFVTTSTGSHTGGVYGANVKKCLVGNLTAPNSLSVDAVQDMGLIPFAISGNSNIDATMHGIYNAANNSYRLPYQYTVSPSGTVVNLSATTLFNGLFSANLLEITDIRKHFYSGGTLMQPLLIDNRWRFISPRNGTREWIQYSDVVSAANFSATLTKPENKILRLQYRYKLN